jgi:hypothetical protein
MATTASVMATSFLSAGVPRMNDWSILSLLIGSRLR